MRMLLLFLSTLLIPSTALAACFDVSKAEPAELVGVLSERVFAGPPGYEDIAAGDAAEHGFILKLPQAICLTGDEDFTDPGLAFDEVQLVSREATAAAMKQLDGKSVKVSLSEHIPAHTAHHRRPLVAWVDSIAAVDMPAWESEAVATVRAFYEALSVGDGETASGLVVAEKRRKPAFSAEGLSRFYGSLRMPLELLDIEELGTGRIAVSYRYASQSKRCDGSAIVRTIGRGEKVFIAAINVNGGC
jgi:hypothetical protein